MADQNASEIVLTALEIRVMLAYVAYYPPDPGAADFVKAIHYKARAAVTFADDLQSFAIGPLRVVGGE